MNFYLLSGNDSAGPYSVEQIRVFLKQGLIKEDDQVWADGWPTWISVSSVPGLGFTPSVQQNRTLMEHLQAPDGASARESDLGDPPGSLISSLSGSEQIEEVTVEPSRPIGFEKENRGEKCDLLDESIAASPPLILNPRPRSLGRGKIVATLVMIFFGIPLFCALIVQLWRTPTKSTVPTDPGTDGNLAMTSETIDPVHLLARAEAGDVDAQCELGFAYLRGKGVYQDEVQAFHWYQLAAEKGNVESEYQLGVMYEYDEVPGETTDQDLTLARQWLQKAVDQHEDKAQAALDRLNRFQ